MNTNNIENLRRMETPVTEEEWTSIVNDSRYTSKFGRKGLSPKGRAALIAGVVAVLITVPILVKTLTNKAEEPAQTTVPTTETAVEQKATETATTQNATETATYQPATSASTTNTPTTATAKVTTTEKAATHEGNTLASVIEKRQQTAENQSREDWPPVLFPEPDGSRLTYENLKTNPERSETSNLHTTKTISPAPASAHDQNVNHSVSETTVTADGQVSTKYEYSPEEPATETEQFFIPTAFTPNGDGLNDLFLVKANFEPRSFELTVLNRGGDALFQTRDMNIGWDGRLHGNTLPHGVYICIIKYKDSQGNEHKQQGQVLLIP